jgi:hypothetical protein
MMIAFGWSVGDIAVAVTLIVKVSKAFKDGSGAVADYDKTVAFLDNLKLSLDALKEYVEQNSYAK